MTEHVLVIARDERTRAQLSGVLGAKGLVVEGTADGAAVHDDGLARRFDLVIVDVAAPGIAGLAGCAAIRARSDVPLILLAATDTEEERVRGLDAGADDVVPNPPPLAELASRVQALLRRRKLDHRPAAPLRRIGALEIDLARHRVVVDHRPVLLTPTEFRLLALLAEEPGRAYSPAEILEHLWHSAHIGTGSACKAHISNLRHKVELDPSRPRHVVTVRGAGYALRG